MLFYSFPYLVIFVSIFLRLTLVLLLISLCAAVLPADFSQGGSIKEHLNLNHFSCVRKLLPFPAKYWLLSNSTGFFILTV